MPPTNDLITALQALRQQLDSADTVAAHRAGNGLGNCGAELLDALVALAVEVQERRAHPYRACEQRRQWDVDAALAALAAKLQAPDSTTKPEPA